jgi:hypothetical protein
LKNLLHDIEVSQARERFRIFKSIKSNFFYFFFSAGEMTLVPAAIKAEDKKNESSWREIIHEFCSCCVEILCCCLDFLPQDD